MQNIPHKLTLWAAEALGFDQKQMRKKKKKS